MERCLRSAVKRSHFLTVDLLMVFLDHWNRDLEGYAKKGVGIPLDEVGDNSRILANLYLQDYDASMTSFCSKGSQKRQYLRFSDDQILMATNERDLFLMIRFAAERLHQIGLSLNAGKVGVFDGKDSFDRYWCFDLFELLTSHPNDCCEQYFELKDGGHLNGRDRHTSILKGLCWRMADLRSDLQSRVIDTILEDHTLSELEPMTLSSLERHMSHQQKAKFVSIAREVVLDERFNEKSLHLCRFFSTSQCFERPRFVEEYMDNARYEFRWLDQ